MKITIRKIFIGLLVILTILSASVFLWKYGDGYYLARARWLIYAPRHYRYQIAFGCRCFFVEHDPLTVEVRNGKTVSYYFADGYSFTDDEILKTHRTTIERIFNIIGAAIGGDADEVADEVHVRYDKKFGFPVEVFIDYSKHAVDDEVYFTVTHFEVLP